jgi:hypothetical protein
VTALRFEIEDCSRQLAEHHLGPAGDSSAEKQRGDVAVFFSAPGRHAPASVRSADSRSPGSSATSIAATLRRIVNEGTTRSS